MIWMGVVMVIHWEGAVETKGIWCLQQVFMLGEWQDLYLHHPQPIYTPLLGTEKQIRWRQKVVHLIDNKNR